MTVEEAGKPEADSVDAIIHSSFTTFPPSAILLLFTNHVGASLHFPNATSCSSSLQTRYNNYKHSGYHSIWQCHLLKYLSSYPSEEEQLTVPDSVMFSPTYSNI